MNTVTCNNCGWVHFAVTRTHAKQQTKEFANFWNNAPLETKLQFSALNTKPEDLPTTYNEEIHFASYLQCFRCGESYKNFRESKPEDCPVGCTIQSILDYRDFDDQAGISL